MIIVWRGLGFVVPLIAAAFWFAGRYATNQAMGSAGFFETHAWPQIATLALAAVCTWFVGRQINKRGPRHTLFWIRVEHWAAVMLVGAVALPLLR